MSPHIPVLHPAAPYLQPLIEAAPIESLIALVFAARQATATAYAPFSKFHVGSAVVMADDPSRTYFQGANVENSSYGLTVCAERTALHYAVGRGFRKLKWIAVSCAAAAGREETPLADRSPCGACRQVIREFATDETLILIDRGGDKVQADVMGIDDLLPGGFRLAP
jgi:cytidine deaminase